MKKALLTRLTLATVLLGLLPGCRDERSGGVSDSGRIYLGLDFNAETVTGTISEGSRASTTKTTVGVDDLQLTLSSNDREWERTYSSVEEFNAETSFPTGDYTLKAFYGEAKSEGFAQPYYYGEADFTIEHDKTTEVTLPVRLKNSIIDVKVTDAFASYMKSYSFTIVSSRNTSHTWDDTPNEDLYVPAGTTRVLVSFEKPNGTKAQNLEVASYTAKACYRHTVTIDYNDGNVGGSEALKIDLNDAVEVSDEAEVDISDKILNAPAPTMQIDMKLPGGNKTTNYRREFVEGCPDVEIAAFNIEARGGIQHVYLTTKSEGLKALGWPETVDLCYPGEYESKLNELGIQLLGVSEKRDVMGVVGLKDVFANIPYMENGSNTSTFEIKVVDWNGKESEQTLKMTTVVSPLVFEILKAEFTSFDDVDVVFRFNGNYESLYSLKFFAQKTIGGHDICPIKEAAEGDDDIFTADLEYDYKYFLEGEGYTLYAQAGPYRTPDYEIEVNHDLTLVVAEENVFATYAIVKLEDVPAGATNPKFQISTDNKNFENVTCRAIAGQPNYYRIDGLKPDTQYWIRANIGKVITKLPRVTFHTEAAAQLVNGSLDAEPKVDRSGTHWKDYSFPGWATMNSLTTSQQNGTDGTTYTYVCNSGTIPTNDSRKNQAVAVRTVGWGSGNTAAATTLWGNGFGDCKHVTAGELFLGVWNGVNMDNDYGISFTSRPSSVSFWYKYETVTDNNGDFGTVEVIVEDAAGKPIASSGVVKLTSKSWESKPIPLVYQLGSGKAAKISVAFKSSGNPDCVKADPKYMTPPPVRNLSTGEYVGSKLYIDEVTLNY